MTGSDWRVYEEFYNSMESYSLENIPFEYGFYYYLMFFKSLNIEFWNFFIVTKVLLFLIWAYFLLKFQNRYFYISFSFFLVFFGLSFFIDNPMRTLIAATFFLFSYKHLQNNNFIKYLIIVLIASLFHVTSLILIPFFWISKINLKSYLILFIFLVFNLGMWILDSKLRSLFLFETGIPHLDTRFNFYFGDGATGNIYTEGKLFSLGLIIRFIFLCLFLFSRNKIQARFGSIFFNLAIFSLFFYRLGIGIPIFERFEFYFCIPFCVLIAEIINNFSVRSRSFYFISIFLLSITSLFKSISSEYKYIPYSNYLFYIFDNQKPSFEERENYNFKNSPYRKK
jgi:hypothetical protein